MKKILAVFCVCFMIISAFSPVCVSSASSVDYSQHISDDILAQLPLKEGDIVFPEYIGAIYSYFGHYNNIDEVIDRFVVKKPEAVIYVVLSQDGSRACYKLYQGEYVKKPTNSPHYFYYLDTFLEGEELKQIDPDIQIEYAYYFNGETDRAGTAIYYKTNLGDYVFYVAKGSPITGKYLLSAEAFFTLHKTYYETSRLIYGDNHPVGGGSIAEMDLSAYQIGSPNFDPNAPFPVPKDNESHGTLWLIGGIALAVVLAAAATWFFLRRRKNALLSNEPESI